jgi:hypothetical protein
MWIIELRNGNPFNQSEEPEAWMGEVYRGNQYIPAPITSGPESALQFSRKSDAERVLRKMSDEFHDRYDANIVEA